jgi:hypothetical protein
MDRVTNQEMDDRRKEGGRDSEKIPPGSLQSLPEIHLGPVWERKEWVKGTQSSSSRTWCILSGDEEKHKEAKRAKYRDTKNQIFQLLFAAVQ